MWTKYDCPKCNGERHPPSRSKRSVFPHVDEDLLPGGVPGNFPDLIQTLDHPRGDKSATIVPDAQELEPPEIVLVQPPNLGKSAEVKPFE